VPSAPVCVAILFSIAAASSGLELERVVTD